MLSGFSFNDAYRIIKNVVDERINALVRSGAGVDILWGTVAGIGSPPNTCSVYLPGETIPSTGFRLENGMKPNLLDPVRVAIDKRGNRWVEAVLNPAAGGFLDVRNNQVTGLTGGTIVAAETDGTPNATVSKLIFPDGTVSVNGGDATIRSVPQGFVGAKMSAASTSFGYQTYTAYPWGQADVYDTDGFHDPSVNPSRVTIPVGLGGKYLITYSMSTATAPGGYGYTYIRKNGSGLVSGYAQLSGSGTYVTDNAVVLDLAGGDYIELMASFINGTTVDPTPYTDLTVTKLDSGNIGEGIGARATRSTVQSIPNGSDTALSFDTDLYDTDGFHNPAVNPTRWTVPAGLGGKYILRGGTHFDPAFPNGWRALWWQKNGSVILGNTVRGPGVLPSTAGNIFEVTAIEQLQAGDYVEMMAYQNSGSALDVGHSTADLARHHASIMRLDSGKPNEPTGSNLMYNGSFERGLYKWSRNGAPSAGITAGNAYHGWYSVTWSGSLGYEYMGQSVAVRAGHTYRLSFRMKTSAFTSTAGAGVAIEGWTGQTGLTPTFSNITQDWTYYSKEITATADDTSVTLLPTNSYGGTSSGTMWLDAIMFEDINALPFKDAGADDNPEIYAFSYENGWAAYNGGGTFGTTNRFYKDRAGFVHLEGLTSGGTTAYNTVIATLPSGFRPNDNRLFPSLANDGLIRLDVNTSGQIILSTAVAAGAWVSLNGVTFYAGWT